MAEVSIMLRRRWWVPIYLGGLRAFIWSFAAFMDEEAMSELIDREVEWVFDNGYYFEVK